MNSELIEFIDKNPESQFALTDSTKPNSIVCLHNANFVEQVINNQNIVCVITTKEISELISASVKVIETEDPVSYFYSAYINSFNTKKSIFSSQISPEAYISPQAIISPNNVVIEKDVVIEEGVIIKSDVVIKEGSRIRSGAVIGGDGFEVKNIYGKRTLIPHNGKVVINRNVDVGYNTCIDKGMFGVDTIIGENVFFDNLCHIGHGVQIGSNTTVTACTELSGSITIGSGVWLAPNISVTHKVNIGDNSLVGIGSVVTKDVPDNVVVAGNPARKLRDI